MSFAEKGAHEMKVAVLMLIDQEMAANEQHGADWQRNAGLQDLKQRVEGLDESGRTINAGNSYTTRETLPTPVLPRLGGRGATPGDV